MTDSETIKFKSIKKKNLRIRKKSSDDDIEDDTTNKEILYK